MKHAKRSRLCATSCFDGQSVGAVVGLMLARRPFHRTALHCFVVDAVSSSMQFAIHCYMARCIEHIDLACRSQICCQLLAARSQGTGKSLSRRSRVARNSFANRSEHTPKSDQKSLPNRPKIVPKSSQNHPKIVPKSPKSP